MSGDGSFPYTLKKEMDKYTIYIDMSKNEEASKDISNSHQKKYIYYNTGNRNQIRFFYHKNKFLRNLTNKKFQLFRDEQEGRIILKFVFNFSRRKINRMFNGTIPILSITPLKFREYLKKRLEKEGDLEYTTFKIRLNNAENYSILLTFDQNKIDYSHRNPSEFGGNFFYLERLEYPEILKSQKITTLKIARFSDKKQTIKINSFSFFKYLGRKEISIKDMNPKSFLIDLKIREKLPELRNIDFNKINVIFDYETQDMTSDKLEFQITQYREEKIELELDENIYEEYLKKNGYFRNDFENKEYLMGISDYFYYLPYFLKFIQESDIDPTYSTSKKNYHQEIRAKLKGRDLDNYFIFPPLKQPDFKIKHYNVEKRTEYFCDFEIIFLDNYEILFTLDHGISLPYNKDLMLSIIKKRVNKAYSEFERLYNDEIRSGSFKALSKYTLKKLIHHLYHLKLISNDLITYETVTLSIKLLSFFRKQKSLFVKRYKIKDPEVYALSSLFYTSLRGIRNIGLRKKMKNYIYSKIQKISGFDNAQVIKLITYAKGLGDLYHTRETIGLIKSKLKDKFLDKGRLKEILETIKEEIRKKYKSDKISSVTINETERRLLKNYLLFDELENSTRYLESIIGHRKNLMDEIKQLLFNNIEGYVRLIYVAETASYLANVLYDFLNASNEMLAVTCFEIILGIIGSFAPETPKHFGLESPRTLPQIIGVDSEGMYNLILRVSDQRKENVDVYSGLMNPKSNLLSKLRVIIVDLLVKEHILLLRRETDPLLLESVLRRLEFFAVFELMRDTLKNYLTYILELGDIIKKPDLKDRYLKLVERLRI